MGLLDNEKFRDITEKRLSEMTKLELLGFAAMIVLYAAATYGLIVMVAAFS